MATTTNHNKSKSSSKVAFVTRKMISGLTKELDKASRYARNGKFDSKEYVVKSEGKAYSFRELG